jgi:hypothetical protein
MKIHRLKGGEFYAESGCRNRALYTKLWDSSNQQHGGIVSLYMPIAAAARIARKARAFSFPPDLPHGALALLNMKTSKLQL